MPTVYFWAAGNEWLQDKHNKVWKACHIRKFVFLLIPTLKLNSSHEDDPFLGGMAYFFGGRTVSFRKGNDLFVSFRHGLVCSCCPWLLACSLHLNGSQISILAATRGCHRSSWQKLCCFFSFFGQKLGGWFSNILDFHHEIWGDDPIWYLDILVGEKPPTRKWWKIPWIAKNPLILLHVSSEPLTTSARECCWVLDGLWVTYYDV